MVRRNPIRGISCTRGICNGKYRQRWGRAKNDRRTCHESPSIKEDISMGANVNRCVALAAVFALTLPASVVAQVADDDVCRAITDSGRAGLFIYYPTRDIEKRLIPVGEQTPPLVYEPMARFFFLAGTGGRPRIVNNESVWNIKSQTSANSDIRANAIYFTRGSVGTGRCEYAILPVFAVPANYCGLLID